MRARRDSSSHPRGISPISLILTNGSNGVPLVVEIRNALADAIGVGAHPELRAAALRTPPSLDFAGGYRLDIAVPLDVRRALTDNFEHESVQIAVAGDAVLLTLPGQEGPTPLIPLGPARFAQAGIPSLIFEFSRDAFGAVRGVTVSMPEANSMAYYVRE